MPNKKIKVLYALLSEIEQNIPFKDKTNPKVTNSDIGWQLDHSLQVFNAVCEWTINSNPKDYERKFSFWRMVLFPIGYIPRGKVKAPKIVRPPNIILDEDLKAQLQTAKTHIEALKTLPENAYFKHFIFGKLSKQQTLRFLQMHTNHHLKIVRDMLQA
ncbi:DUF1569 domain-containing protein [Hwangdonia lutea]|uniref:DUF1569 domain-containing protein n=1 Tax=Hwangdonia lutea TaxID=3075823 RepID=A0AA97ES31_9FLAO|nr:DUF1569 domain-containing protein [Hwangdonia sp. SCSIO 19198]WOD44873.1 DUF1569 domain-containing protein [Hwangdonia sp. SCSIO 19198]